jgi:very-short-patch-repair endonuclease
VAAKRPGGVVAAVLRPPFGALALEWPVPHTRVSFEMRTKAKGLRRFATKAESLLWYELRVLKADGLKFRRQSPIGPYIADFVCFDPKLVVEIDGDTHETDGGKRHDANRDGYLASLGFRTLRYDAPDVLDRAWHVAQAVKAEADLCRTYSTHPGAVALSPLEGERAAKRFRTLARQPDPAPEEEPTSTAATTPPGRFAATLPSRGRGRRYP